MAALVDSNVILDLFADSAWRDFSVAALAAAANRGRLVINPIIYAEISVGYETIEILDALVPPTIEREAIPYDAAFLAGKAYVEYRRRGGMRRSPLPTSSSVRMRPFEDTNC